MGKHSKIAKEEEEEEFSLAPTECPIPMKTKKRKRKVEPTTEMELELELKVEINLVLGFRERVVVVELFRVLKVVKQEEKERDVEDRKNWDQNSFLLFLGPSSFH